MEASTSKPSWWVVAWPLIAGAVLVALGLWLNLAAEQVYTDQFRRLIEDYRAGTTPAPTVATGEATLSALWGAEVRAQAAPYRLGSLACYLAGGVLLLTGAARLAFRPIERMLTGSDSIQTKLEEHSALLDKLGERMLISDAAKRIVFRAKDREALRQAIREDIDRGEFDAALVLVDEMAGQYGYREEAEEFREEILATRQAVMDEKLSNAIVILDGHLDRYDWHRAAQEAAKIRRLFPDHPRAMNIEKRVREARDLHKHDLERQFLDAAQRDDVDRAWELMKELDEHLTEVEAEPFREIARGVIGKKRENLGVQFKLAVHDREWIAAVDIGQQIIRDFPNTKMAIEVRSMLDLLRERAAGQRAARA